MYYNANVGVGFVERMLFAFFASHNSTVSQQRNECGTHTLFVVTVIIPFFVLAQARMYRFYRSYRSLMCAILLSLQNKNVH